MNKYSTQDRVFLVESYYKSGENITLALRKWSTEFKNRPKPSPATLEKLIEKFKRTGEVTDDVQSRKDKPRTSRTPEIIESAREIAEQEPTISTRRLSQRIGVSRSTAWTILNKDLKLFPYKVQIAQQLTEAAVEKRLNFANEVCQLIDESKIDITKIIFSDEAHFWLDGYVNRQNYRIWGSQKPELLRTKPLHPAKLTVWCGLTADRIIGPFFIESSITSDVYNTFLREDFLPVAEELEMFDHFMQQDGAPPHTTRQNLELLREHFGSRVIARGFPEMFDEGLAWPPYSPDISPLDFFLWGYVKDKVYQTNPKSLSELKNSIIQIIENVPQDILRKAIGSFENRLRLLIHTNGEHIENILH